MGAPSVNFSSSHSLTLCLSLSGVACTETKACHTFKHHYEECAARVASGKTLIEGENCVEELCELGPRLRFVDGSRDGIGGCGKVLGSGSRHAES